MGCLDEALVPGTDLCFDPHVLPIITLGQRVWVIIPDVVACAALLPSNSVFLPTCG